MTRHCMGGRADGRGKADGRPVPLWKGRLWEGRPWEGRLHREGKADGSTRPDMGREAVGGSGMGGVVLAGVECQSLPLWEVTRAGGKALVGENGMGGKGLYRR